ncbi:MAG: hypothetical protein ACK5MP_13940 [Nostocoides sp.]
MDAGYGLTVRWSLADADESCAQKLRDYVVGTSIAKFMFLEGLAFKVWRMREGEWFEGVYVFDSAKERDEFEEEFTVGAAKSPGSTIIGSGPAVIERYEVVAIAEGPAQFRRGPGPGTV